MSTSNGTSKQVSRRGVLKGGLALAAAGLLASGAERE